MNSLNPFAILQYRKDIEYRDILYTAVREQDTIMKSKFFFNNIMVAFLLVCNVHREQVRYCTEKKQNLFCKSLLVFILARCVRVRQQLVPRHLSAIHDLALPIHLRTCGESVRVIGSSQLSPSLAYKAKGKHRAWLKKNIFY